MEEVSPWPVQFYTAFNRPGQAWGQVLHNLMVLKQLKGNGPGSELVDKWEKNKIIAYYGLCCSLK